MISTGVFPFVMIIEMQQQKILADYFRSKKAVNPENAIELDFNVLSSLLKRQFTEKDIYRYSFIKRAPLSGRFYLDEIAYRRSNKVANILLVALGIGAFSILIGLFLYAVRMLQ